MGSFRVEDREQIMHNCYDRIQQIAPVMSLFDEGRMALITIVLAQYLTAKYYNLCSIVDDKYLISSTSVGLASPEEIYESVKLVLDVRDTLSYEYDTTKHKELWQKLWNDKHIHRVLKYEGFIS